MATVAAIMVRSTTLGAAATGGVLLRMGHTVPGTANCLTTVVVRTEAPTLRRMGFLCAASGISPKAFGLDSFDN